MNSCVGTPRSTWGGDRRWVAFLYTMVKRNCVLRV